MLERSESPVSGPHFGGPHSLRHSGHMSAGGHVPGGVPHQQAKLLSLRPPPWRASPRPQRDKDEKRKDEAVPSLCPTPMTSSLSRGAPPLASSSATFSMGPGHGRETWASWKKVVMICANSTGGRGQLQGEYRRAHPHHRGRCRRHFRSQGGRPPAPSWTGLAMAMLPRPDQLNPIFLPMRAGRAAPGMGGCDLRLPVLPYIGSDAPLPLAG